MAITPLRLPLIGGAYAARSVIANAQRCINYFPEMNRKDAPQPFTFYQRAGKRLKASDGQVRPVRGLYQASNGAGYCVIGAKVYYISPAWALTLLGTITPGLNTPVSFTDNGANILLVDGSVNGWTINLLTNAFAVVVDPTGTFTGATRVDTLDTYILWNMIGTNRFGSTTSGVITPFFNLSRGAKSTYPDPLVTLICRRTEVIVLGRLKGEIWYNVGGAIFPFARLPGAYIEHGITAPYSLAASDVSAFWLSQDLEGKGLVLKLKGYEAVAISNPALSNAIDQMTTISDAIAYCYQQQGHLYYVLHFPSADQTWVYDDLIGDPDYAWHQQCWTDSDGILHRDRGNCFAVINGVPCVGDWQYGSIYQLDKSFYFDSVNGVDYALSCIRTFPPITKAFNLQGEVEDLAGRSANHLYFMADMQVGNGALDPLGAPSKVGLRWSDDSGMTWGQTVLQSDGAPGEYRTVVNWPGLGVTNKRIYELSHSINGEAALQGAFLNAAVNYS